MSEFIFEENVRKEEFQRLASEQDVKSHFLGSYNWGKVSENQGWRPHYLGVRKDGKIVATILALQKNLLLGYSYFYIPRGFTMDYSDKELLRFVTKKMADYCKRQKALYFRIDPDIKLHTIDLAGNVVDGEENSALVSALVEMGYRHKPLNYFFENEQPRFTFRIDLTPPIEEIEGKYSRTTKTRIKQAHQSCVEVTQGTSEEIDEFVRLMTMTEKRQDFFSHTASYYHHFYDAMDEDGMVSLYFGSVDVPALREKLKNEKEEQEKKREELADKPGKKTAGKIKEVEKKIVALSKQLETLSQKPSERIVASTYLVVHYQDKSWALYAANDMDYGKFFPNYMVYEQQIRDAKKKGHKIFDVFGTIGKPEDRSNLSGLYEFKKKWGGEYTEFIGEFDYVQNKFMYALYKRLIPIYHRHVNKKLRKQVQEHE